MSHALTPLTAVSVIKKLFVSKDERELALIAIRENPEVALAVIADRETMLSTAQRARAFDEVIGEISSPVEARRLVDDHFHEDHVTELLAQRGGLPSSAIYTLDRDVIITAMLHDTKSVGQGDEAVAMVILSWAHMLKHRDDWQKFLSQQIEGVSEHTLGDLLLLGLWYSRDRTDMTPQEIELSEFLDLGFDEPEEAHERLGDLLHGNEAVGLRIQSLRLKIGERQTARARLDAQLAQQTVEAAKRSDVDVDL